MLNSLSTAGLTRLASPVTELVGAVAGVVLVGVGEGDAEVLGVLLALGLALVPDFGLAASSREPVVSPRAPAWPVAPGAPAALGEDVLDAPVLGEVEGATVGGALGVVVVEVDDGVAVEVGPPASSTWRKNNCAVLPTRSTTFVAFAPGTVITMSVLPCCWTCAPLKPAPFTRAIMIDLASFMSEAVIDFPETVVSPAASPRCRRPGRGRAGP